MKIEVVEYSCTWEKMYEEEAAQIRIILGDHLVEIYHIGSTSVQGLKSKPIIDMMPVVKDISAIDKYNNGFKAIGYECMGEFGIPGRRYFRKGGDNRTHQIHMFEKNNQLDIVRHLAVRDYLRTHNEIAYSYGKLKAELAVKYPNDIDGYCDGKDAFVKRMEETALVWYKTL